MQFEFVTLIEKGEFVSKDLEIAKVFVRYFPNITKELEISENPSFLDNGIYDPNDIAIAKYRKHLSIKKIKEIPVGPL